MNRNNSQAGNSPSDSSFSENNENQYHIDQLLSVEIETTDQRSSSIQLNPTDMIVRNIQQHNNVPIRQHARRGRQNQQGFTQRQAEQQRLRAEQQRLRAEQQRLRAEQQRQREEQQRLRQEQQQQRREQQCRRRERNQRRYEQWQERVYQRQQERYQREQERYRREQEEEQHDRYLERRSPNFDEMMDEILQERQLEAYCLERMTPKERQELWEQEHLNELQGNPAPRAHGLPTDDLERYANFLQGQLWRDQHDQAMQIYEMQNNDYTEECLRNEELLMQKQEWDDIAFHLQQLK